jgi:environmental stress-induced protein Ves
MRILRSVEYRRMPWKNGGGETREIAVSPAGATLDTLDWRVSLASVAEDGPFSVFKGVQRTLCVISGAGIQLQAGDRAPAELRVTSEPYAFDGEVATSARLIDGPIEDLNVMSRRGRFGHSVRRLALNETFLLDTNAHTLAIYCQRGEILCVAGDASGHLQSDDTATFDQATSPVQIVTTRPADLIVIELFAA